MSFKTARIIAGKKVQDVVEHMGVSSVTVWSWENGVYLPSAEKLPQIAAFYGCSIDDLFNGNPMPKRTDEVTQNAED